MWPTGTRDLFYSLLPFQNVSLKLPQRRGTAGQVSEGSPTILARFVSTFTKEARSPIVYGMCGPVGSKRSHSMRPGATRRT
jgi:hypothetical protein